MKTRSTLASLALALALAACQASGAEELLETAKLEEVQQNIPHARKLYQEIIDRHPDSPQAKVARERLDALGAEES